MAGLFPLQDLAGSWPVHSQQEEELLGAADWPAPGPFLWVGSIGLII